MTIITIIAIISGVSVKIASRTCENSSYRTIVIIFNPQYSILEEAQKST